MKVNKKTNEERKTYYTDRSITRGNFKKTCKRRGWKFKDFKEECSGEFYRTEEKFFYIPKSEVEERKKKSKKLLSKLMAVYKLRMYDIEQLKTVEARFYSIGLGVKLEDLTNAIQDVCLN